MKNLIILSSLMLAFMAGCSESESVKYNNQAYDLMNKGEYSLALEYYTKAIDADKNAPNPYVNRAKLKLKLQDYQGSIQDSSEAISVNPNYPDAYYIRSVAFFYISQIDKALDDAIKAYQLDKDPMNLFNLGAMRFCLGVQEEDQNLMNLGYKNIEESKDIYENKNDRSSYDYVNNHLKLTSIYLKTGKDPSNGHMCKPSIN